MPILRPYLRDGISERSRTRDSVLTALTSISKGTVFVLETVIYISLTLLLFLTLEIGQARAMLRNAGFRNRIHSGVLVIGFSANPARVLQMLCSRFTVEKALQLTETSRIEANHNLTENSNRRYV